jgi:FtsZ-binding cell division protein ZapB
MFDVIDIKMAGSLDKSKLACYASLGNKVLDVLIIANLEQQLSVPINDKSADLKLVIKLLSNSKQRPADYLGSVSLPTKLINTVKPNKKVTRWITLFDTIEDDDYDGDFTEDDFEEPMILVEFFRLAKKGKRVAGQPAAQAAVPVKVKEVVKEEPKKVEEPLKKAGPHHVTDNQYNEALSGISVSKDKIGECIEQANDEINFLQSEVQDRDEKIRALREELAD